MPWCEEDVEEDDDCARRRVQAWIDSTTPPCKRRRITRSNRNPLSQISNIQASRHTLISPDSKSDSGLPAQKDKASSEMEEDRKVLGLPRGPTRRPKTGFDGGDDVSEDTSRGSLIQPPESSATPSPASLDMNRTPRPLRGNKRTRSASLSTDSRHSKRSTSPVKEKPDLRITFPRIEFVEDVADLVELPERELDFVRRIIEASKVLPTPPDGFFDDDPMAKLVAPSHAHQFQDDSSHSAGDIDSLWRRARKIQKAAKECSTEAQPEECWSDAVIYPILDLSLCWAGLEQDVKVTNIKTVTVEDKSLLPTLNDEPVQSKRVDYALCLRNNPSAEDTILKVTRRMNDAYHSISQSAVGMMQARSPFSNIEIKAAFGGVDPGPQLGVWCCAGFSKLASLSRASRRGEGEIPFSPCWTAEGHVWRLYMAKRSSVGRVDILGSFSTWETKSPTQVVSLILALAEVVRWGHHEYRKWFMSAVDGINSTRT